MCVSHIEVNSYHTCVQYTVYQKLSTYFARNNIASDSQQVEHFFLKENLISSHLCFRDVHNNDSPFIVSAEFPCLPYGRRGGGEGPQARIPLAKCRREERRRRRRRRCLMPKDATALDGTEKRALGFPTLGRK